MQHELLAWHLAGSLQPHMKKGARISPAKLLGKDEGKTPQQVEADLAARSALAPHKRDLVPDLTRPTTEHDEDALRAAEDAWIESVVHGHAVEGETDDDDDDDGATVEDEV